MSRETALFFAVEVPVVIAGAVIARLLDFGDTDTFLATMGPVSLVMLVFILREPRHDPPVRGGAGGRTEIGTK